MKQYLLYSLFLLSLSACQPKSKEMSKLYEFDLQSIAQKYDSVCKIEKNNRFGKEALIYQPVSANNSIVISGIGSKVDWSSAKYLICEVYNSNDCDAIVKLDFYKNTNGTNLNEWHEKEAPTISPQIGVLPFIKTKLVLPLSGLDGQSVTVERMPGQLTVIIFGSRLDPKEVGEVRLSLLMPFTLPYKPKIEIASIYLTNELPEKYSEPDKPLVDKFGQWNYKDWPRKIKDEAQLKNNILALEKEASNSQYPEEWSQYGGWKQNQLSWMIKILWHLTAGQKLNSI